MWRASSEVICPLLVDHSPTPGQPWPAQIHGARSHWALSLDAEPREKGFSWLIKSIDYYRHERLSLVCSTEFTQYSDQNKAVVQNVRLQIEKITGYLKAFS